MPRRSPGASLKSAINGRALLPSHAADLSRQGLYARELEIKLIETIGISSYDDQRQHDLKIIKNIDPKLVGDGEGWLAIDDLVDSGATAKAIRKLLPKTHLATVYAKPAGEPLVDTYVTWVSQDTWIYFPWEVDIQPMEPIASVRKQV